MTENLKKHVISLLHKAKNHKNVKTDRAEESTVGWVIF